MQLSKEVHYFSSACERLLASVAMSRPLTEEETHMIEYYCHEVLNKAVPPPINPDPAPHSSPSVTS